MATYEQLLTNRKASAAAEEAAFIQHFGKEAQDCDNWQRLWQASWMQELVNNPPVGGCSIPTLPRDEEGALIGGWINEQGNAYAYGPGLYSKYFLYTLAKGVAEGGPTLISRLTQILHQADYVDCDQLAHLVDSIATFSSSYTLRYLVGTSSIISIGESDQAELFFRSWNERKEGKGIFICRFGIAIPGRPIVPHDVAANVLSAVRRQIEARRVLLSQQIGSMSITQEASPNEAPDGIPERLIRELFVGFTPAECYELAVAVGFIDSKRQPKGSAKPGKIWGMVETLVWYGFAETGKKSEYVQLIADSYSIKISADYTPDSLTDARRKARSETSRWLIAHKKVTNASNDIFRNLLYQPRLPPPEGF